MNRRTLKKHCKRAMETLIAEYGYSPDAFFKASGEETLDAPPGMERRYVLRVLSAAWLEPGPLKGTWLIWESYPEGDGDCKLPIDVLEHIRSWEHITPEEIELPLKREPLWIGVDIAAPAV